MANFRNGYMLAGAPAAPAHKGPQTFNNFERIEQDEGVMTRYAMYNSTEKQFISPTNKSEYKEDQLKFLGFFHYLPAWAPLVVHAIFLVTVVGFLCFNWVIYAHDICDPKMVYDKEKIVDSDPDGDDDDDMSPLIFISRSSTHYLDVALVLAITPTIIASIYVFNLVMHLIWTLELKTGRRKPTNSMEKDILKADIISAFFKTIYYTYADNVWTSEVNVMVHFILVIVYPLWVFLLSFYVGSRHLSLNAALALLAFVGEGAGLAMNMSNQLRNGYTNTGVRHIRWSAFWVRVIAFASVWTVLTVWLIELPSEQTRSYLLANFCTLVIVWGVQIIYQAIHYLTNDIDFMVHMPLRMYHKYHGIYSGGSQEIQTLVINDDDDDINYNQQETYSRTYVDLSLAEKIEYFFYAIFYSWTFAPFVNKVRSFMQSIAGKEAASLNGPDAEHKVAEFVRVHFSPFMYDFIHIIIGLGMLAVYQTVTIWPICDDETVPIWLLS